MRQVSLILVIGLAMATGCSAKPAAAPTTPPPTLRVRVESPSGALYRGGMRWTLRGTCNSGQAFHSGVDDDSFVPGGEWVIDWPDACARTSIEVSIAVMVNWMRCAPAAVTRRVAPGDKVVLRLQSCVPPHEP